MSGHAIQMIAGLLAGATLAFLILRRRAKAATSRKPAAGRR